MKKKTLKNCLISAGPTREWIDPVRYISNPSTGKMGYALAEAAKRMGMQVTLVSGNVNIPCPQGVKLISVDTALEMKEAMYAESKFNDLIIMCAAVSDHRPSEYHHVKLHKDKFPRKITMTQNPDILKNLGTRKSNNQVVVGFAAETNDVLNSAKKKLIEKNLDWIIANDISQKKIGFESENNEVTMLSSFGEEKKLSYSRKSIIAEKILNLIHLSCQEKAH